MKFTAEDKFNAAALMLIVAAWPSLTSDQREAVYDQVVTFMTPKAAPVPTARELRVISSKPLRRPRAKSRATLHVAHGGGDDGAA
jgi:hypothetical protein